MKKIKSVFLVFFIAFASTSCVNYEQVKIEDIKEVRLISFSDKGLVVESDVMISNPNFFDIKIVDSELNITVKGREIAVTHIDNQVKLPSNSSEYHTLRLKSSFDELGENVLINLVAITSSGSDVIDFKFEGYIVGRALFLRRKVEVFHEDSTVLKLH